MAGLKGIVMAALVLVGIVAVCVVVCLIGSIYLSIPYDEWVNRQRKKRGKKNGKNHSR